MYLHEDPSEFGLVATIVGSKIGRPPAHVAKDYFVTMMLRELLTLNPQLVFKGGTALSKCYGVIKRFSEDIDLGIEEAHATQAERKRIKDSVCQAASNLGLRIANLDETRSRRDFNRYVIPLPETCAGSGLAGALYVETAVMTPVSPATSREVSSLISEHFSSTDKHDFVTAYTLEPFRAQVTTLERAFCDKVFALCDYYLERANLEKHSRHMYDLCKLEQVVDLDEDLCSLMMKVREQRKGSSPHCPSAADDVRLSETLRRLLKDESYRTGYERTTMRLLDPDEEVGYAEAAASVGRIADFLVDL